MKTWGYFINLSPFLAPKRCGSRRIGTVYPTHLIPWLLMISRHSEPIRQHPWHCCDAIMGTVASQITSLTIVYTTVYSDADQSRHQSSASLAFMWGIHRGPVNSPHKGPVTRKMFSFDDVIMIWLGLRIGRTKPIYPLLSVYCDIVKHS